MKGMEFRFLKTGVLWFCLVSPHSGELTLDNPLAVNESTLQPLAHTQETDILKWLFYNKHMQLMVLIV